jgi:hypothetical protein
VPNDDDGDDDFIKFVIRREKFTCRGKSVINVAIVTSFRKVIMIYLHGTESFLRT